MSNWMIPYEKLDPAQKEFVNGYKSGNTWVLGYAGSGKSILLVHLLKRLKDKDSSKSFGVVVFTRALCDLFRTGFEELRITNVPVMTQFELSRNPQHFDYLFCDEIQDMSKETLAMIRSSATCVIAAGDSNQSIFGDDLMTHTPTVTGDQPVTVLGASKKELNIIYRLTQSIISAVKRMMPHMSRNWTAKEDLTKVDVQILVEKCSNREKECKIVYEDAKDCCSKGERTVILFPKHEHIIYFVQQVLQNAGKNPWSEETDRYGRPLYSDLNNYLRRLGIPMMYIGNNYGSLAEAQEKELIILMTYSSSKGLDFENVYMPFVNKDLFITQNASLDRTTFMVAMTRSSRCLNLFYTGEPSDYIKSFWDDKDHVLFKDDTIAKQGPNISLW